MAGAEERIEVELQPFLEPYGRMLVDVSEYLIEEYRKKLCMALEFSPVDMEKIKNGPDVLNLMEERNIFNRQDVSNLEKILDEIVHRQAAKVVRQYRDLHEPQENLPTQCVASVPNPQTSSQQQTDEILTTPMTKVQKKALDLSVEVFEEGLNVSSAIEHLTNKGIFKTSERELIIEKPTQHEKVLELVNVLKKKGTNTFEVFQSYLGSNTSSMLAEELQENLVIVQRKDQISKKTMEPWLVLKENMCYERYSEDPFGPNTNLPKVLHFMLLGKTGAGKSATGNTILDTKYFTECHTSVSQTKVISLASVKEGETIIKVMDTPGLFETGIHRIVQGYHNRTLCLEIAKAVLTFKEGIHLILLIYNPSSKFTQEEEDVIQHIEDVMKKDIYKYCVLILTHSRGKFTNISLSQFLEDEKKKDGKFAALIRNVDGRVLAVDNSFEEAFSQKQQRDHIVNHLAKIVRSNDGDAYRNTLINAAMNHATEKYKDQLQRLRRNNELMILKERLAQVLCKLLSSFKLSCNSPKQLIQHLEENIDEISQASGVDGLKDMQRDVVKKYFEEFIKCNLPIITKYMQLTELKAIEKERNIQQLQSESEKENKTSEMQKVIIKYIHTYFTKCSKRQLKGMQKTLRLPNAQWSELSDIIKALQADTELSEVQNYVTITYFESPDILQEYINNIDKHTDLIRNVDENLKTAIKKCNEKYEAEKRIQNFFPEFVRKLTDDQLQNLKDAFNDDEKANAMVTIFIRNYMPQSHEVSFNDLCKASFIRNKEIILGIIEALNYEREKLRQMKEERNNEQCKTKRIQHISFAIEKNLQIYFNKKSEEDLKIIAEELSKGNVPDEIFKQILEHLYKEEKMPIDPATIHDEILTQIKERQKILEKLIKDAHGCFAKICTVSTRHNAHMLVSMLKVGDEILVYDAKGKLKYERVYLLSHANPEASYMYIEIVTLKEKVLLISPNHYLPVGSLHNNVPAKEIVVGQSIFSVTDGVLIQDTITSVSYKMCKGAYCPITINGTIVVNYVAASCFTTVLNPSLGQALLFPVRLMFHFLPKPTFEKLMPYDSVEGMPLILAICRSAIIFLRSAVRFLRNY